MFIFSLTPKYAVFLLTVISIATGNPAQSEANYHLKSYSKLEERDLVTGYPCPADVLINPCTCLYDNLLFDMFLDCSGVADEAELETILKQEFPFSAFNELLIDHSGFPLRNIVQLTAGVFGNNTFKKVIFLHTDVETIEQSVFDGMKDTLELINFEYALLIRFNMDFTKFTQLKTVEISNNAQLMEMYFVSPTVTEFSATDGKFMYNQCQLILPSATNVDFSSNSLTELVDISSSIELVTADFSNNALTTLREGDFCNSNQFNQIDLQSNAISAVEFGSLCVKPGTLQDSATINLSDNKIEYLDESIWVSVIPDVADGELHLEGNPLNCGCEIAWIFGGGYETKINNATTCYDGTLFMDINPEMLNNLCPP